MVTVVLSNGTVYEDTFVDELRGITVKLKDCDDYLDLADITGVYREAKPRVNLDRSVPHSSSSGQPTNA
jgi:hypothetical protein